MHFYGIGGWIRYYYYSQFRRDQQHHHRQPPSPHVYLRLNTGNESIQRNLRKRAKERDVMRKGELSGIEKWYINRQRLFFEVSSTTAAWASSEMHLGRWWGCWCGVVAWSALHLFEVVIFSLEEWKNPLVYSTWTHNFCCYYNSLSEFFVRKRGALCIQAVKD